MLLAVSALSLPEDSLHRLCDPHVIHSDRSTSSRDSRTFSRAFSNVLAPLSDDAMMHGAVNGAVNPGVNSAGPSMRVARGHVDHFWSGNSIANHNDAPAEPPTSWYHGACAVIDSGGLRTNHARTCNTSEDAGATCAGGVDNVNWGTAGESGQSDRGLPHPIHAHACGSRCSSDAGSVVRSNSAISGRRRSIKGAVVVDVTGVSESQQSLCTPSFNDRSSPALPPLHSLAPLRRHRYCFKLYIYVPLCSILSKCAGSMLL